MVGYWLTRYAARGTRVATLGMVLNLPFSLVGCLIYAGLALLYFVQFNASPFAFILAILQIPTFGLLYSLDSTMFARRPEVSSYGFLTFEIAKVILGFLLIPIFGLGLEGAISVIILAQVAEIAYFIYHLRDELRAKIDRDLMKRIVKMFWLPGYSRIGALLEGTDIILVSLITFSFLPVALFRAASVFTAVIMHTAHMSGPLYVKLLSGGGRQDVEVVFRLTTMFVIPIAVGVTLLSRPLLYILNPEYFAAGTTLSILAIYSSLSTLSGIFTSVILGTETIDTSAERVTYRQFVKSKLFKLPTIDNIWLGCYLVALTIALVFLQSSGAAPETIILVWSVILTSGIVPVFAYKWHLARKILAFRLPALAIGKYFASAAVMGIVIWTIEPSLAYSPRVIEFAPQLFLIIAAGIATYFGALSLLDKETRALIALFVNRNK